jgi:hypothetical protein
MLLRMPIFTEARTGAAGFGSLSYAGASELVSAVQLTTIV